jgi:NAD(P)H-flavin reductase
VIVAGGIGLAPLRPAIYEILRHRRQFGKVALLYGARTPDEILFRREIERWRSRLDLEVMVTVDRAAGGWLGSVGVVTTLIPRISFALEDTVAFICGPEIMMRFSARDLIDRGIPPAQVHVSMERNMKCGVGLCGHCQWGADFVCKDGPVYTYAEAETRLAIREV